MRTLLSTAGAAVILIAALALPLPAHAASGPATTQLPAYNGSASGPRNKTGDAPPYFKAIGPAISRSELGAGGYARFVTAVQTNAFAANWSANGMLEAAGFLRVIPGETPDASTPLASPAHDGDPIVFMQFNSSTAGYCANRRFMRDGAFVFGKRAKCGMIPGRAANDENAMPRLRWTVTLNGDGSFRGTLALLDNGAPIARQSFAGRLPGTAGTEFIPVVRLRAGSDTGAGMAHPNRKWSFRVLNSRITLYSTVTTPLPPHILPYLRPDVPVITGFGGMAAAVARHHPAR